MGALHRILNYQKTLPGKFFQQGFGWRNMQFFQGGIVRRALVETFAKEEKGGLWYHLTRGKKWYHFLNKGKAEYIEDKFYNAEMRSDRSAGILATGKAENAKEMSLYAWWKFLNPVKWTEFVACVVKYAVEEFTLLAAPKVEGQLTWKNNKGTILSHAVSYPVTLAYDALRWFTAPYNQVFRPAWNSVRELWVRKDETWGKGRAVALALILLGVAAFIIASLATGGTLPVFAALSAAIYSAVPVVAGWFGSTLLAAEIFLGYTLVLSAVAMTQRFFSEFKAFFLDIKGAWKGEGGYSKKVFEMAVMTREGVEQALVVVPGEPGKAAIAAATVTPGDASAAPKAPLSADGSESAAASRSTQAPAPIPVALEPVAPLPSGIPASVDVSTNGTGAPGGPSAGKAADLAPPAGLGESLATISLETQRQPDPLPVLPIPRVKIEGLQGAPEGKITLHMKGSAREGSSCWVYRLANRNPLFAPKKPSSEAKSNVNMLRREELARKADETTPLMSNAQQSQDSDAEALRVTSNLYYSSDGAEAADARAKLGAEWGGSLGLGFRPSD